LQNEPQGPASITPVRHTAPILYQERLSQSGTPNIIDAELEKRHLVELHSPQNPANVSPTSPVDRTLPFHPPSWFVNNGKYLVFASLYLTFCVATACWMLASGPKLVPQQDTRITNAIISILSKIALTIAIWILAMLLRIQWTRVLISGRPVKLRGLLVACGANDTLDRLRYLRLMPTLQIGITTLIGLGVTLCMILTSAGFKYSVIPGAGMKNFLGPDFETLCNYSNIIGSGYFCIDRNALNIQWTYLNSMNSGMGGNIVRSENATSGRLSANVTLTSAPANIRLPSNPPPPWAAMDVGCTSVNLGLRENGTGALARTDVIVDGHIIDTLSISTMPSWGSQIIVYQVTNDTGPWSHMMPCHIVLLARNLNDGGSNINGLAGGAVQYLGDFYLDLHGPGPTVQGVLGAAAYCNFGASAGGDWPLVTWPAWNTTNAYVGAGPVNGKFDISTIFLNYGPGWQYSPVFSNSIPGAIVSYIANFTTDAPTFPHFIATYIRNQWALVMHTSNFDIQYLKNTSYNVMMEPSIHIEATAILAVPLAALVCCIGCAVIGVWMVGDLGAWYERVDNAPWWLMKAVNAMPGLGDKEANEDEFERWAEEKYCQYEVNSRDVESRALLKFR